MRRYRVQIHWEPSVIWEGDAENEEDAEQRALQECGGEVSGTDVEDIGEAEEE